MLPFAAAMDLLAARIWQAATEMAASAPAFRPVAKADGREPVRRARAAPVQLPSLPHTGQRQALARALGCARVVFNDGLRARQDAHANGEPYITDAEMSARLTAVKATQERAWLGEVSAVVLQQAVADLGAAYRNFFASVTGKHKGPKVAPPRFRSRKDRRQAIRFTRQNKRN